MNKQSHFLIITWNFPPKRGGMENLIYNIYKSTKLFADVQVISPDKEFEDPDIFCPKNKSLLFFMIYSVYMGIKLAHRDSVIMGGSFLMAPVLWLIGAIKRCKTSCYIHGLDLIYGSKVYQLIVKFFIKRIDQLFANSKNTKKIAVSQGCCETDVSVVSPFLSHEVYEKITTCKNYSSLKYDLGLEDKKVLLSVGRLTERKGLSGFIGNCFRFLVKKDKDIVLLISGDNPLESLAHKDGEKQKILNLIDKYELQDNIKFLGHTDFETLIKLYRLCDIFIFPGINIKNDVEGFGMVAIEAAAAEKMVIGFDVGGISDAVDNNATGKLISEKDYNCMLNTLFYYLCNFEENKAFGQRGLKMVKNRFLYDTFQKNWENLVFKMK